MAGNVGDIVEIVTSALWQGVTMRNVYFYRVDDTPTAGYLTGLSTEFQSSVWTAFMATQLVAYVGTAISIRNVFTGDVLEDLTPTPAVGTLAVSGDTNPPFLAVNVGLERQNNRVKQGRKSVPIPTEGYMTSTAVVGTFLTNLNTYAALLDDVLQPGGVDDFTPVIVGRVKYTTPLGKEAYRLPVSQAEMGDRWSPIVGSRVYVTPTTMNTRKFGRGE